jgi:hypothetical protein
VKLRTPLHGLALGAALDLIVPGKFLRLGLHQPIRHAHPSAFNGRVNSDSIASSTLIFSVQQRGDGGRDRHVDDRARAPFRQHRRGEGAFGKTGRAWIAPAFGRGRD